MKVRVTSVRPLIDESKPKLSLSLKIGPDEEIRAADVQNALGEVGPSIQAEGHGVMPSSYFQKSVTGGSWLTGDFIVHLIGGLGIGGLLTAWLNAKLGRRVRVKIGDLEAEASSAEEVERLLERANEIRKQMELTDDEDTKP